MLPLSVLVWCGMFSPRNNKIVKFSFLSYDLQLASPYLTQGYMVKTEMGSGFPCPMAVRRVNT